MKTNLKWQYVLNMPVKHFKAKKHLLIFNLFIEKKNEIKDNENIEHYHMILFRMEHSIIVMDIQQKEQALII